MSALIHRTGDLFEALADPEAVLVHAVSLQSTWGGGVAAEFYRRFPKAFAMYAAQLREGWPAPGSFGRHGEVAWLYTAVNVGTQRSPRAVAQATEEAAHELFTCTDKPTAFHSPRINAGLFGVPWHLTESALRLALEGTPHTWTVWTLP